MLKRKKMLKILKRIETQNHNPRIFVRDIDGFNGFASDPRDLNAPSSAHFLNFVFITVVVRLLLTLKTD
jgi:hypothetical protein